MHALLSTLANLIMSDAVAICKLLHTFTPTCFGNLLDNPAPILTPLAITLARMFALHEMLLAPPSTVH
jgi:hypothetical protein